MEVVVAYNLPSKINCFFVSDFVQHEYDIFWGAIASSGFMLLNFFMSVCGISRRVEIN
jgi:hypothetical protein